jgi:hypothetical protein
MHKPSGHMFSYLVTYRYDLLTEWVAKVKPDINSVGIHP